VNDRWVLTELGRSKGGQVRSTPETGEFVVWPEDLSTSSENTPFQVNETERIASEGEDYIAEYLSAIGLSFDEEVEVRGLKSDVSSIRRADFYLPKYGVYIEFAGLWNSSETQRTRYRTKRIVYENNSVPCIWLYPDNLGILHYIFHRRLEDVLKKHKRSRDLLIYRLGQLWKKDSDNLFGVGAGITGLVYLFPWNEDLGWALFWGGAVVYNIYRLWMDIIMIKRGQSLEISRLTRWDND
ncbi:MAG TPA: hypothetical protein VG737_11085, partial [Cyclobacteriaceae bacterium]|nr:hypothetical protein [Cyclobacteriaceae bacterium]